MNLKYSQDMNQESVSLSFGCYTAVTDENYTWVLYTYYYNFYSRKSTEILHLILEGIFLLTLSYP